MTKRKSSSKDFLDQAEKELSELSSENSKMLSDLATKNSELEKENMRLKQALKDMEVDLDDIPAMSDEEYICLNQLEKLRILSDNVTFAKEDAEILEKLQKTLKSIKGNKDAVKRKPKKATKAELLKIVNNGQ